MLTKDKDPAMQAHNRNRLIAAALFTPLAFTTLATAEVTPVVQTGLDNLIATDFKPLVGRKIGLITNHTAVAADGRHILPILHNAENVNLVAIFSPEHGFAGTYDAKVGHSVHDETGLPIYSLYGETRRPTAEMLADVDTLVFDIQDIGTRFYTYIATMGNCMEAAAKHDIRFVVLDRPNPITGTRVFGPFNDVEGRFTAYHHTPLVHGMTVGELARMFNSERNINADLQIIEMTGWKRDMWFDETGLRWIHPSPNMRSLTQATLYPAIGMIEACEVSVGRGTDTPFELFGAPYFNPIELAAALNKLDLAGLRFIPFSFTPDTREFKNQRCHGVQIVLLDREAFDPAQAGLAIAHTLEQLEPTAFDVENVNNLIFAHDIVSRLEKGSVPPNWTQLWQADLKRFQERRANFLLYE